MKKVKNSYGITLISLIITILIMLILAGVVLKLVIGNNGLFKKVVSVVSIYNDSKQKEDDDLLTLEDDIDNISYMQGELIEKNNVIKIFYKKQLETLRNNVSKGNTYLGKIIEIKNDIDLNEGKYEIVNDNIEFTSDAEKWQPIGDNINPFEGTIDGKGFIIKGLYINNSEDNQGFIGYNKGEIKNIGIKYGSIKANNCVGALVGINEGNISNCFNNININANTDVGGIIGKNYGSTILNIDQCCNLGNIKGLTNVGGIVGTNYNTDKDAKKNITNCYNTGNITSTDLVSNTPITGGIVGHNALNSDGENIIKNCYSIGKITGNYETNTGGIVGKNSTGTIINCYYLKNSVNGDNDVVGLNKGEYKTMDELKLESTYENWDLEKIWYLENNGILKLNVFKTKI